jgi:recombination protein RecA
MLSATKSRNSHRLGHPAKAQAGAQARPQAKSQPTAKEEISETGLAENRPNDQVEAKDGGGTAGGGGTNTSSKPDSTTESSTRAEAGEVRRPGDSDGGESAGSTGGRIQAESGDQTQDHAGGEKERRMTTSDKSSDNSRGGKKAKGGKAGKPESAGKPAIAELIEQNQPLMNTLQQIEKQFGEGSIMPLGGDSKHCIEGIPTGSLSLDIALGGQGIPRGRIIEIFGPESSGKTTLALHVIAQAQKADGIAAFIDAEHAFDPSWGKKLGVQLETLLVSQPTSGEEAMQITEMLIKSNAVDVIVVDSVAALVPKQELEGDIGDSHVGLQARLMSQSMRKLTGAISKSKTAVVFINQIREKIGVMFGSPETTPGGRALKFYSSCRIDVRRIGQLKEGEEVVGQRVRCKVVKNKVAPPFRVAEFDMMHTHGISYEGDVLDLAVNNRIVARSGAWFKYQDAYLGQGKEKARAFLVENPHLTEEIRGKLLSSGSELTGIKTAAGEGSD